MRVLQRAAELLGSERALARRLQVPLADLMMWLAGDEKPTKGAFLEAVDLLIERGSVSGIDELDVPPGKDGPRKGKRN